MKPLIPATIFLFAVILGLSFAASALQDKLDREASFKQAIVGTIRALGENLTRNGQYDVETRMVVYGAVGDAYKAQSKADLAYDLARQVPDRYEPTAYCQTKFDGDNILLNCLKR